MYNNRYFVRRVENDKYAVIDTRTDLPLKDIYGKDTVTDNFRYAENIAHIWNEADKLNKINNGEK